MDYPPDLLPGPDHKKIEWSEDLCSLFLLRHVPTRDFLGEDGLVRDDCISRQTDHLRDLSTILLGKFHEEDSRIEIINKEGDFLHAWNDGDLVCCPVHGIDFILKEERCWFYWNIGKVVSLKFSHVDNMANFEYILRFKILHTPVRCNFWHFSIQVFCQDDHEISTLPVRNNLKKAIWRTAKERLRSCAVLESPVFNCLNPVHYLKKETIQDK